MLKLPCLTLLKILDRYFYRRDFHSEKTFPEDLPGELRCLGAVCFRRFMMAAFFVPGTLTRSIYGCRCSVEWVVKGLGMKSVLADE